MLKLEKIGIKRGPYLNGFNKMIVETENCRYYCLDWSKRTCYSYSFSYTKHWLYPSYYVEKGKNLYLMKEEPNFYA